MLTITPCLDKQTVAAYCKKCRKLYSAAFYLYLAKDRDELLAAGLFEVGGEQVQVVLYEADDQNDPFLFDGILRAGLNYAAEQGITKGVIPEAFRLAHGELFARLNYPIQSAFDISNFFHKYKNCSG